MQQILKISCSTGIILKGYLLIDNELGAKPITGNVSFAISWSDNIFTDSLDSEVFAGVFVYIKNSFFEVIFDYFIEFDSLIEEPVHWVGEKPSRLLNFKLPLPQMLLYCLCKL